MARADPIPELKRQLGAEIAALIGARDPEDIALLIGTDRRPVVDLRREKLDRFSLESLIRFAARLRLSVEIRTTRRRIGE